MQLVTSSEVDMARVYGTRLHPCSYLSEPGGCVLAGTMLVSLACTDDPMR
jgi:hypothetical protein